MEPLELESTPSPPFSWKTLWHFMGPGFLMSIAFLDPGNLEGDLQAGVVAGYSLLWLLMSATLMGLMLQLLSARLGVVTGRNLAELCREEYPKYARMALWGMVELTLIAADIQEVIGSAMGIRVLSNGRVPLWVGVVISASDCFLFLFLENYGIRKLEAIFAILILAMAVSFAGIFAETKPNGIQLLKGLVIPRLSSQTLHQAVGMVGCVITPHNIFLHSALVQSRRIDHQNKGKIQEALNYYTIESSVALLIMFTINLLVTSVFAKTFYATQRGERIGLGNAGTYLQQKYGGGFLPIHYIWGIGLLAAGQSSTITGTYAGQFIMGGFLNLRIKKWQRSTISRGLAIVPTVIVAVIFRDSEAKFDLMTEWLNLFQCVQIPFALTPLLTFVSKERLMGSFTIRPLLQAFAWFLTAILFMINGYLLVNFFIAQVSGVVVRSVVCIAVFVYLGFIVYLLRFGIVWIDSISSKLPSFRR